MVPFSITRKTYPDHRAHIDDYLYPRVLPSTFPQLFKDFYLDQSSSTNSHSALASSPFRTAQTPKISYTHNLAFAMKPSYAGLLIAAFALQAAADNCTTGLYYCGSTLIRKGTYFSAFYTSFSWLVNSISQYESH